VQAGRYFLYSMQLSWYSAKVRPYLRYRRLPFDERTPTFREYNVEIKRRVGHAVVPVVITPEGEWLQDSRRSKTGTEPKLPVALPMTDIPNPAERRRWCGGCVLLQGP
jgi:hypothetical protein